MIDIEDFENKDIVKDFLEHFDVYYTNLGGYKYTKDDSPCFFLNGMLSMFIELQKEINKLSLLHFNSDLHLDAACEEIERLKGCCKDLENKVDDLQNQKEILTKYLGRS